MKVENGNFPTLFSFSLSGLADAQEVEFRLVKSKLLELAKLAAEVDEVIRAIRDKYKGAADKVLPCSTEDAVADQQKIVELVAQRKAAIEQFNAAMKAAIDVGYRSFDPNIESFYPVKAAK